MLDLCKINKEMDDYSVHSLIESKNEWCARLLNILTPMIIAGFNSIWKDAFQVAAKNNEKKKYLMTFQNYLSQVPKWSNSIVQTECKRILENSGCSYLEDLLTCVHVIQLKALSCVRVGQRQRKIDIDIPSLEVFVHNVYTNCARKIYTNVYLFESDIPSLQIQKNNRELEQIIRECIMNTIRDSIPTEKILRTYMDETEEEDVETKEEVVQMETDGEDGDDNENKNEKPEVEKLVEENKLETGKDADADAKSEKTDVEKLTDSATLSAVASTINVSTDDNNDENSKPSSASEAGADSNVNTLTISKQDDSSNVNTNDSSDTLESIETPRSLKFNDNDETLTSSNNIEIVSAPKDIDRLERISEENNAKRKAEEEEEEEDDLKIGNDVMLDLDQIVSLEEMKI